MIGLFKSGRFWIGVGVFALGVFASSKTAREMVVKGMAAGLKTKDDIVAGWNNIKEEAKDLYEDAKEEAAAKADDEVPKIASVEAPTNL